MLYTNVLASLERLQKELQRVKGSDDALLLSERATIVISELRYLFESEDTITVVWLERRPSLKPGVFNTHITATPIAVADILRTSLFANFDSVVLARPRSRFRTSLTTYRRPWASTRRMVSSFVSVPLQISDGTLPAAKHARSENGEHL